MKPVSQAVLTILKQESLKFNLQQKMKKLSLLLFISCLVAVSAYVTAPIDALGTTLPLLTSNLNYRVFNDLMKQSLPMVPYQQNSYNLGRLWNKNLNFTNGLLHAYPANLSSGVYGMSEIKFYPEDGDLVNKTFNVQFQGSGTVGVYQSYPGGSINVTWASGTGGSFVLKSVNQSLQVWVYFTTATNPVNSISVVLASLGSSYPTFTSNFIDYLQPFNLIRTCFWQGQNFQNQYIPNPTKVWADRPTKASSTQISQSGVALQHILELQGLGMTLWPCVLEKADTDYITKMATLFANTRTQSNIMYLQFANVFTIMNDFPDRYVNVPFDTFMQAYGPSYRNKVLFTINYKDIQYYINAVGMRTSPPINFTYIDAIGAEASFGVLDATVGYGLSDSDLKKAIINVELAYETTLNTAFQLAKRNGTNLIMFSGGPYLKVPAYTWNFRFSQNYSNQTLKTLADQETSLQSTLVNMNLNDPWVPELYLHWIARLKSMGVTTFMFSRLVGAFTNTSDIVPLLSNLNSTTQTYKVLRDYALTGRTTTIPTIGVVPPNPFTCSPSCVWGDCIYNICQCYAGYSGSDCSVYTAPNTQNKVGMNLQGVSYWTTQHPFIDMHREGSAWVYFIASGGWSSGQAFKDQVPLDSNGYPTYLPPAIQVGTLIARDVYTHYDNGTYVVLYDGDGILQFGMYDVPTVRYGIGRVEIDVVPSTTMNNGILVTIARTNPNNYIRNIRVIRPGFEGIWQALNFSPLMLEKLQPFGTLRFMDWTNTNGQTDSAWESRTLLSHRAYTKNGVAWQETIRLANTLGKNIWVNIPHLATDDYVTKLAQLIFNNLEPHLTAYVEYSNQVWGTLFPGGQYAQAQGVTLGLAPNDPTQARFCYLGLRTNQISTIWSGVFGSSGRLKVVVSTQAVNADTTKRILECQNTSNYVDAVAIAPYLSISLADNMSSASIIAGMAAQIPKLGVTISTHLTYTNQYNLLLMCYESGQGLEGSTSTQTNLQIGVQTAVQMRQIYLSYMEMLFNNSIVLANHFSDSGRYTKYGSWGLFQYVDERLNTSMKWLGTNDYFIEQGLVTGVQTYGSCNTDCNGNGICSLGQCLCYSDYTGPTCTIGKFVEYKDCGYYCTFNQGTCGLASTVGNNLYYNCTCLPGYTGFYCSIPICSSKCNYNGTCVAPNNCSCFRGRMGDNCELDCGCGGHGTCNSDQTCQCDTGYVYNTTSKNCEFACNGQASALCYGPNLLSCPGCASGACNNGVCTCWPGFTGDNCTVQVDVTYVNSNFGINVGGLSYWSTQHLFKDYFKQSSQWIPHYYPDYFSGNIQYTWNTEQSFPTLNNGYPASLYANMSVGKLLLRDVQLRYPSIDTTNKYVLLYDGDGVIQLGMDAKTTEYSAGRIKFTVTPSTVRDNGIYVRLILTNPDRPVQNIRVLLENDEYNYAKDLLTQNFLTFMSQFSTIRYMDLLSTNGNPVSAWSQATSADKDTQAQPTGISFDLLAGIVKRTGTNAWVNVPHQATDDYVTQMASFLRDNIPLKRTIYVEYSNEVWNTAFDQGQYATAQAAALNLSNYHKFYGTRSIQIFNIFTNVFGGNSRLKFVIAYQAVSQWVANQILTTSATINNINLSLSTYPNLVVAAAPYYDCNSIGDTVNSALVATQNASTVIQRCKTSFASLSSVLQIGSSVSGNFSNIPMATYEAGTAISEYATIFSGGETPAATTTFIAANKDPGMYDVYKTLLYTYKQNNLTATAPLMLFSSIGLPSKYGSWGILDYLDQINETPTHPKFQAVLDFNQGL